MAWLKRLGTILLDGFLITLPVLLVYLMLGGIVDGIALLTTPVVDLLPVDLFDDPEAQRWVAAGVLVGIFLLVGAASKSAPMRRLGAFVESRTLARFAPYAVLKSLSQSIGGKQDPSRLQPALLSVAPDTRMLVAIVEELPEDELCVYVPVAPTPAVGFLQIVHRSKVERLDVPMADALGSLFNWGAGTADVLAARSGRTRRHSSTRGDA